MTPTGLPDLPPSPLRHERDTGPLPVPAQPVPSARPAWLVEAERHLGLAEVAGRGSNPEIIAWAKEQGGWIESYFKDDDIAWCALFACHCLHAAGLHDPRTLAAGDFQAWGHGLSGPSLGAACVLSRPGGHHVGFYLGTRPDGHVRLLGGNTGNKVAAAWFDPVRVLAWRWPAELAAPDVSPVALADDGQPTSVNEG